MQLIRRCFGILLFVLPTIAGCSTLSETARRQAIADSLRADSIRIDSIRTDSIRADSIARADSIRADSVRTDSIARADSIRRARGERAGSAPARRFAATDTVPWPTLPDPAPGALLPSHRIIAYYGNPLSKRMGILGELPPAQMLAKLEETAADWAEADSSRTVIPALHMIVTVAQGSAGADGKYRLRMSDSLMHRVAQWAEERRVPELDLTDALQSAAAAGRIPWWPGDTHWNAIGHEVAGQALAPFLSEQRLLAARPPR